MKQLELKPFDQAAFDSAYMAFHTPGPAPEVKVATLEYMAALLKTFAEGAGPFNMSPTAIEHMTPEAASFAQYGDYREFTPSQAFLDEVAATVRLIGIPYSFDAP